MPNNSSSGGYLVPAASPAPVQDDVLDDALGDMVAAITGLTRDTAVLPRFQAEPPNLPDVGTNWVAIGVQDSEPDFNAAVTHSSSGGTGADTLQRNEVLDLLCSFYGPNAKANAALLSDGLQIPQNREALRAQNIAVVDTGKPTRGPVLLKNKWFNRVDLTIRFRRLSLRVYPILDLATANGTVSDGILTVSFNTTRSL